MARRGRPTAAATHSDEDFAVTIADMFSGKTKRTYAAIYYRSAVYPLLSEAASVIPYLDGIFRHDDTGCYQKGEIIEQLGRMLEHDGHSPEDVLYFATLAAQHYHDGYTVKQIKAWLLQIRTAWKESVNQKAE